MEPSYLDLYKKGVLEKRVEESMKILESCTLCPRKCGINRLKGETGFCRTGRNALVASYSPHFGEESPLVGTHGSGTIFFSSCNLLCSFCQNFEISHLMEGVVAKSEQIAGMMLELAERGCHNINFVTPSHVVPQILESLLIAIDQGLNIPLVYNSGGYDSTATLSILDNIFDIYMPDFKFWDNRMSQAFCQVDDYREIAMAAIKEMHRQTGDLMIDDQGIARRGLIIRHLVMPNNVAGSKEIFKYIAAEISENTYVNVMDQYRPCGNALDDKLINRHLDSDEFKEAMESAGGAGLKRLDPRERMRFMFIE